jgi:hypothetical protein
MHARLSVPTLSHLKEPGDHRRRNARKHSRKPDALDREPAGNQAWRAHARESVDHRATERVGRVSGDASSDRRRRPRGRALPVDTTIPAEEIERASAQLDAVWRDKPGLWGWLSAVDHKTLGKRYLVTAFLMFIAGGSKPRFMRAQLARPENSLIGP